MRARHQIVVLLLLLAMCLAAGPSTRPSTTLSDDDYAAHVDALRQTLPREFTILIQKPFVVIGDESPSIVRKRAEQTVGWAVERLKRAYFAKDPDRILNIWLFKDANSYETHAERMFGERPETPYGYYSSRHAALVMNISTGGGTLVHEIVHPFIEANFPACPAWFNEGLGSLYEQSSERDGEIVGLPNWRLAGLKKALDEDRVLTFKELTSLDSPSFYDDESGRNYAQARYLCLYLQEMGLLKEFYQTFSQNHADDPTGYRTLCDILGDEMQQHERDFARFVRSLRFP